jgi:hypothetical protein
MLMPRHPSKTGKRGIRELELISMRDLGDNL